MGGMAAALSLLFMMLTGVFPLMDYTLPALSGLMLVIIVVEINTKWAVLVYIAVSLLSLFIAPLKESAVLYIAFFGYYAIVKSYLERLRNRIVEWILKFLLFNAAIVVALVAIVYLLGMNEMLAGLGEWGVWGAVGIWLLANAVFLIYDLALTRVIGAYINWFRPRYLKKLK